MRPLILTIMVANMLIKILTALLSIFQRNEPDPVWCSQPRPTELEKTLRFLEGETILEVEHENQFKDRQPVFTFHLTDGRWIRFHPITWGKR